MSKSSLFCYTFISCLILIINAKVYKRCELVRELKNRHNIPYEDIGEWICIMFWESGFDTKAHRIGNFDGSSNFGIFQISDLLWCQSNGRKNNTNFCDSSCDKFRDSNINDDIKCALLIYKLQGFDAWGTYNTKCRSDTSSYVEGCLKSVPNQTNKDNKTETDSDSFKTHISVPSVKDLKQSSLIQHLFQMSKSSLSIPEKLFGGERRKRSVGPNEEKNEVSSKLKRSKRGLLGQDSINPFEDARIFVFNPLCCYNWKAAEVEWSNAKNWYIESHIDLTIALSILSFHRMRDIRTSVG